MAADALIPLNIVIGDRNYRIKILPQDEEAVRRTLKTINDKIIEFRTNYAGKDMQDYVSMVLIWYATQPAEKSDGIVSDDLLQAILKMEKQIDELA